MMRASCILLLLLLAAGPAAGQQAPDPAELAAARALELMPGRPLDRQILVTFADPHGTRIDLSGPPGPRYRRGATYRVSTNVLQSARRIANEHRLETVDEWPIRPLGLYCLVYSVPADEDLERVLERLNERPEVQSAQRMNVFETRTASRAHYDDPYADLQHALDTLQIPEAHLWSRGEHVQVAIIDTGADAQHPDLRTQLAAHRDFVARTTAKKSAHDRHGTALAGIIGAAANNGVGIVGIAPGARLHVLKACWHPRAGDAAVCTSFTLARALSHAIESGAEIINLSLAGPPDPLLSELLRAALARSTTVIAARPPAGAPPGFPVEVRGVIVVDVAEDAASSVQVEPSILRAPGRDILVAAPGASYELASGTSLATAHAAGVAALLKARARALGPNGMLDLLAASISPTHASINACRALAALLDGPECDAHPPAVTQLGRQ